MCHGLTCLVVEVAAFGQERCFLFLQVEEPLLARPLGSCLRADCTCALVEGELGGPVSRRGLRCGGGREMGQLVLVARQFLVEGADLVVEVLTDHVDLLGEGCHRLPCPRRVAVLIKGRPPVPAPLASRCAGVCLNGDEGGRDGQVEEGTGGRGGGSVVGVHD